MLRCVVVLFLKRDVLYAQDEVGDEGQTVWDLTIFMTGWERGGPCNVLMYMACYTNDSPELFAFYIRQGWLIFISIALASTYAGDAGSVPNLLPASSLLT